MRWLLPALLVSLARPVDAQVASPIRSEILSKSIEERVQGIDMEEAGGMAEAFFGAAGGIATLSVDLRSRTRGLLLAAMGTWTLGGLASHALRKHDYGGTIALTTTLAGLGTAALAFGFGGAERNVKGELVLADQPHLGLVVAGLALYAETAVIAVDRARHRPVAPERLRRDDDVLATPTLRALVTPEELAGIEDDLSRSSSPTSIWLLTSPLYAGALVSTVGLLTDHSPGEAGRSERWLYGWSAATLAMEGLLIGATNAGPSRFARYQRRLRRAGFDVGLAPGGAEIVGTF